MPDSSRALDSLHRDIADLKRRVASIAEGVSALGDGAAIRDALRAASRRAGHLGAEAQQTARRHPLATGVLGLAVLGAALCLASYAAREHRATR